MGIARRLNAYLSANQLGITLASLGLGWIGEPVFARLLQSLFASFDAWSVPTAHAVAVIASFAAITLLHTILGELVPKSLAIQRTEPVAQYTRYPLAAGDTNRVLGYVHLKDIMAAIGAHRPPGNMRELIREPIYAAEGTPLEQLRREFLRRRIHLAVITGAQQSFTGIVTREDLLEEFVGEIRDEQDADEVPPIVRQQDGSFAVDGRMTLDVAARELGLLLPDAPAGVETLGGYVRAQLGERAQPGQSILRDGFRLTVLEMRDGRVRRLRGEPLLETHAARFEVDRTHGVLPCSVTKANEHRSLAGR